MFTIESLLYVPGLDLLPASDRVAYRYTVAGGCDLAALARHVGEAYGTPVVGLAYTDQPTPTIHVTYADPVLSLAIALPPASPVPVPYPGRLTVVPNDPEHEAILLQFGRRAPVVYRYIVTGPFDLRALVAEVGAAHDTTMQNIDYNDELHPAVWVSYAATHIRLRIVL